MIKSATKNIINLHYRKLNKFIKIVSKHFEPESIHQLRVEYKKQRAFLRMISEEKDEKEKIKIPGKLKKAYHIAGEIRDLQLQHQRILVLKKEETIPPEAYLQLLEQHIKKLKPEFSGIPLKKTIKKTIKKAGKLTVEKISTAHPDKFIDKNCAAIIAIITSSNFSDLDIHTVRKHLKDIFYTIHELEGVDEQIKFSSSAITNDEMEYFDQLLEEMGNFQDKCISITFLNEQWLYSLNSADQQILKEIKEIFTADKCEIKNDLVIKLQNELIPHLQVF